MLALTLHQPWASLIILGAKRFETRGWETPYTGWLAIHAGKTLNRDVCAQEPFREVLYDGGFLSPDDLPAGALVGMAFLRGCIRTESMSIDGHYEVGDTWLEPAPHEYVFGDWSPGRFAWGLGSVAPMPAPVPCRGYQKLWQTPANLALPPLPRGLTG